MVIPSRPRLSRADVGAWLVRSSVPAAELARSATLASTTPGTFSLARCLRPSYRLALMRPGDPCLLWVSGRDRPGVQAVGRLLAVPDLADPTSPTVDVELTALDDVLPRAGWVADPVLAAAEVIRMPAGSNPSVLTPAQAARLADLHPEVRTFLGR